MEALCICRQHDQGSTSFVLLWLSTIINFHTKVKAKRKWLQCAPVNYRHTTLTTEISTLDPRLASPPLAFQNHAHAPPPLRPSPLILTFFFLPAHTILDGNFRLPQRWGEGRGSAACLLTHISWCCHFSVFKIFTQANSGLIIVYEAFFSFLTV